MDWEPRSLPLCWPLFVLWPTCHFYLSLNGAKHGGVTQLIGTTVR